MAASLRRALLSLCLLTLWGCEEGSKPTQKPEVQKLAARARELEAAFERMRAGLANAGPSPCPEATLLKTIRQTQNRTVPFIDERSLELSARGKPLDPKQPLERLASGVLARRRPSTLATDEKAATDAAFDAMALAKEHDFVAVLRYRLKRPRADAQGFHGGELEGLLVLFELGSARPLCATEVLVQSHEQIARRGDQSPQQAADHDFDLELRQSLEAAFRSLTPELNLDMR